jgi:hypothetical protein
MERIVRLMQVQEEPLLHVLTARSRGCGRVRAAFWCSARAAGGGHYGPACDAMRPAGLVLVCRDRDVFNEKPSREEMLAAVEADKPKLPSSAVIHTSMGDIHCRLFAHEYVLATRRDHRGLGTMTSGRNTPRAGARGPSRTSRRTRRTDTTTSCCSTASSSRLWCRRATPKVRTTPTPTLTRPGPARLASPACGLGRHAGLGLGLVDIPPRLLFLFALETFGIAWMRRGRDRGRVDLGRGV